jgi:DNA-binding transcriptional LysR family regulator
MAQFRETFPAIAVEIVEHEDRPQLEQALRDRKADIGFTYLPTDSDFESWELLRDEYVVLMPQQTNFGDRGLDWESLARYPLILPPPTDSCSIQVLQHLEANQQELNVAYRVREDSTIVRMVAQGLGVAILPQLAAEPIPPGVEMRSLPVRLERIIGVAIVADALQAPAVFAFLDTLKHWIAQPQATISGITPTPGLPREPSVR